MIMRKEGEEDKIRQCLWKDGEEEEGEGKHEGTRAMGDILREVEERVEAREEKLI